MPTPATVNLSLAHAVPGEAAAGAVGSWYITAPKGPTAKEQAEPFLDVCFTESKAEAVFRA